MKLPKQVENFDDERSDGNGIIVNLKKGWAFSPHHSSQSAIHVEGFDTIKEAISASKNASKCCCDDCIK